MGDTRRKDVEWTLNADSNGFLSWQAVTVACLMDLRDELRALNRLLNCGNFLGIPGTLRRIALAVDPPRSRSKKSKKSKHARTTRARRSR